MADYQPLESLGDDQDDDDQIVPSPSDYADPGENPQTGVAKRSFWPKWMRRLVSRRQAVQNFDQAMAAHSLKVERSNLNFRRVYAAVLLVAMVIQVGIADWFFYLYLRAYEFRAPEQSMSVWIGAAVVQLIGLVVIITKYLFPNKD
ncbi:hypothetical protein BST11_20985 [Mycobacterium alsense]|uniref:Uncharacterized protein n=1 Tax=Mycobacterium alsense TaxID=324058 RepID=A0AA42BX22_9MYCO|nr:hypothetical protein [Mycobacterium alsense]MCV7377935.1 hypothetical protein [Mycobacterium alsense]OQZ88800.1 hypothetical protein BST11_20985 [Mycobacterium alsense]